VGANGTKVYHIDGPLFFAAIPSFRELFSPADDPENVIVDFANSRVYGHAGLDAIDRLAERYEKLGKRIRLVHLSSDCKALLKKAGDLVTIELLEDPHYHLAVDELA
jgi:SulP family sulfate permease